MEKRFITLGHVLRQGLKKPVQLQRLSRKIENLTEHCFEPAQEFLVLIPFASREGSEDPAHMRQTYESRTLFFMTSLQYH